MMLVLAIYVKQSNQPVLKANSKTVTIALRKYFVGSLIVF